MLLAPVAPLLLVAESMHTTDIYWTGRPDGDEAPFSAGITP